MSVERVIAMVVDTDKITLYRPNGTKIIVPQGHPRISAIVDAVLPVVQAGGVAEVDVTGATENPYRDFESSSSGLIRFFRVAKRVIAPILMEIVEEMERELEMDGPAPAGATAPQATPGSFGAVPAEQKQEQSAADPMRTAVNEIISHATPATSDKFTETPIGDDETVVAVVGDKAVPGVEALRDQLKYANKLSSPKGIETLIARMAAVADKRMHSVQDLLRFLEKADLPIANDGSIIAYKILRNHSSKKGYFVDCHTKKVEQCVGSFVCVDEALVDKNRRNECSNGLHIARRGYIGNFDGDVVVLAKVAPEDVIVVPHNDANKVRVCGYHIISELPSTAYDRLKNNKPMTDDKRIASLLSSAIAGRHVVRTEEVRIHGQMGTDVKVKPLVPTTEEQAQPATEMEEQTQTAPAKKHTALDDPSQVEPESRADPKQIAQQQGTRTDRAQQLFSVLDHSATDAERKAAAEQLKAFKKSSKVSWTNLGITESQVEEIESAAAWEPPVQTVPTGTRQEIARAMYQKGDYAGLWDFKRKAKVGWDRFGFNAREINTIEANKPGA
jgi:hypothetical protein